MNKIIKQLADSLNIDLSQELIISEDFSDDRNLLSNINHTPITDQLDNAFNIYIFNYLIDNFEQDLDLTKYMTETELLTYDNDLDNLLLAKNYIGMDSIEEIIEETFEETEENVSNKFESDLFLNNYEAANRLNYLMVKTDSEVLSEFQREAHEFNCFVYRHKKGFAEQISPSCLMVKRNLEMFSHFTTKMRFEMETSLYHIVKDWVNT